MSKTKSLLEKIWVHNIAKKLIGRSIVSVQYISNDESKQNMWSKRPIAIELDDGNWLVPVMDDECNDGGSMTTTYKDLDVIPVLRKGFDE
jgi:hypothetical protein